MSCKKYKILLSAYIDGEITAKEEKALKKHLKVCPDCAKELEHLGQVRNIFRVVERKEPSEFFESRVLGQISTGSRKQLLRRYEMVFRMAVPAVLAAVLIIMGVVGLNKIFRPERTVIISDLLVDEETEQEFDQQILELYYGSL
jgi:anti-sigma factor RsiW